MNYLGMLGTKAVMSANRLIQPVSTMAMRSFHTGRTFRADNEFPDVKDLIEQMKKLSVQLSTVDSRLTQETTAGRKLISTPKYIRIADLTFDTAKIAEVTCKKRIMSYVVKIKYQEPRNIFLQIAGTLIFPMPLLNKNFRWYKFKFQDMQAAVSLANNIKELCDQRSRDSDIKRLI